MSIYFDLLHSKFLAIQVHDPRMSLLVDLMIRLSRCVGQLSKLHLEWQHLGKDTYSTLPEETATVDCFLLAHDIKPLTDFLSERSLAQTVSAYPHPLIYYSCAGLLI